MVELISPEVPWPPYTNADFPTWLLPIHWGSVIITSTGFVLGYFLRWRKTPVFLLAAYTMLFTICVIETFGFMTSPAKYYAMTAELVTYTAILLIVFRHPYFKGYFNRP